MTLTGRFHETVVNGISNVIHFYRRDINDNHFATHTEVLSLVKLLTTQFHGVMQELTSP